MTARAARAVTVYRWVYAACIVALSVPAVIPGAAGRPGFVVWLGTAEVASALLLAVRATERVGLWGLLAVFAVAAAHHVARDGVLPASLVLYAASAVLVVTLSRDAVSRACEGDPGAPGGERRPDPSLRSG